jgi:hypothetical protein
MERSFPIVRRPAPDKRTPVLVAVLAKVHEASS